MNFFYHVILSYNEARARRFNQDSTTLFLNCEYETLFLRQNRNNN